MEQTIFKIGLGLFIVFGVFAVIASTQEKEPTYEEIKELTIEKATCTTDDGGTSYIEWDGDIVECTPSTPELVAIKICFKKGGRIGKPNYEILSKYFDQPVTGNFMHFPAFDENPDKCEILVAWFGDRPVSEKLLEDYKNYWETKELNKGLKPVFQEWYNNEVWTTFYPTD